MENMKIYYATNRKHSGKDRWQPDYYSASFSDDGLENLRFGKVTVDVEKSVVDKYLNDDKGEDLTRYFTKRAKSAKISAYKEEIDRNILDIHQPSAKFGSLAMFNDLKKEMEQNTDVLIFIHGFSVSWYDAVGSAMALQAMLNRPGIGDKDQKVLVILFTWPSDGPALPYVSYKSERLEAKSSGYAFGRGILKLRDFLGVLSSRARKGEPLCAHNIHLLCHSMGNYVLQHALGRIIEFTHHSTLPRIFEHIFLCAADVDDNVLESNQPMGRLHELCRYITIYYNKQDVALSISDYTKGNPDRLGTSGVANPTLLHYKIHQVDCTPVVHGIVEHSYHLLGVVNEDIRLSIDGVEFGDTSKRRRRRDSNFSNVWVMC